MIGIKAEIESYNPVDIFSYESMNGKLEEEVRDSIKHYNKALELFKMDSEDIAILELKRAITLNPNFNEAVNLLGLCYAHLGEDEKAVEMFKIVVESEKNSIKALDYIGKIDGLSAATDLVFGGVENRVKSSKNKRKQPPKKEMRKVGFFENYMVSLKYHLPMYLICVALGAAFISISRLPSQVMTKEETNFKAQMADMVISNNELIAKNKTLSNELNSYKNPQQQTANQPLPTPTPAPTPINQEAERAKIVEKLTEAETLNANKKYEQAADVLMLLKDAGPTGVEKEKFDKMIGEIVPKATWNVFLQARDLFNAQNFKDSSAKYAKVLSYGGTWDYTPETMYNLGKSYAALGDKTNAINTYKKLKQTFPSTDFAGWADARLTELGA